MISTMAIQFSETDQQIPPKKTNGKNYFTRFQRPNISRVCMYIQMIRFNRFKRLNESELDHHFDKNEPKKKEFIRMAKCTYD